MKQILCDSSVWVSFLAGDKFFPEAEKIIQTKAKIIVPSIVYFEVMNVLGRSKISLQKKAQKTFYESEHLKIVYPSKNFWKESIQKYSSQVHLKSLDLLIVSSALEFNVDEFYSFDVRQLNAYNILLSHEKKI